MNIYITRGNRANRPFLLSCEDKSVLPEGQTEWITTQTSEFVTGFDCVCTREVYDEIIDKVGTLEAPALIANANSPIYQGRTNVYIENGSLKIKAQS